MMNVIDERILFHNLFRFLNLASNLEEVYGILWCFVESIEISIEVKFEIQIWYRYILVVILVQF